MTRCTISRAKRCYLHHTLPNRKTTTCKTSPVLQLTRTNYKIFSDVSIRSSVCDGGKTFAILEERKRSNALMDRHSSAYCRSSKSERHSASEGTGLRRPLLGQFLDCPAPETNCWPTHSTDAPKCRRKAYPALEKLQATHAEHYPEATLSVQTVSFHFLSRQRSCACCTGAAAERHM